MSLPVARRAKRDQVFKFCLPFTFCNRVKVVNIDEV